MEEIRKADILSYYFEVKKIDAMDELNRFLLGIGDAFIDFRVVMPTNKNLAEYFLVIYRKYYIDDVQGSFNDDGLK